MSNTDTLLEDLRQSQALVAQKTTEALRSLGIKHLASAGPTGLRVVASEYDEGPTFRVFGPHSLRELHTLAPDDAYWASEYSAEALLGSLGTTCPRTPRSLSSG